MSTALTALNVNVLTLDGTSYLGDYESFDFPIEVETREGKSASDRYSKEKLVKRNAQFTLTNQRTVTDVRQTNLDMTVCSYDGEDWSYNVQSATIISKTNAPMSDAGRDPWQYKTATGTVLSGSMDINILATDTTTFMRKLAGDEAGLLADLAITAGGLVFVQPILLKGGTLGIERDGIQTIKNISWTAQGGPTTATGVALWLLCATGSATAAFSVFTGLDLMSGDFIIDQAQIQYANREIIKEIYQCSVQGAPTITAD